MKIGKWVANIHLYSAYASHRHLFTGITVVCDSGVSFDFFCMIRYPAKAAAPNLSYLSYAGFDGIMPDHKQLRHCYMRNFGTWLDHLIHIKTYRLFNRFWLWAHKSYTKWVLSMLVHALRECHYTDVIMGTMASQITCLTVVNSTVYSGADQRKHQSSASLAFVRGIHRWPVNSRTNDQ